MSSSPSTPALQPLLLPTDDKNLLPVVEDGAACCGVDGCCSID